MIAYAVTTERMAPERLADFDVWLNGGDPEAEKRERSRAARAARARAAGVLVSVG